MVWPSPPAIKTPSSSSSPAPHRRLSIGRLHRTASPSPVRTSSNRNPGSSSSSASSSNQRDWQHQRQQQSLDLIPYDPPAPPSPSFEQHQYQSFQQSSSSSLPSTTYQLMPGSFHDFEPDLPSSEEEDMFRLAHATSPFTNTYNSPFEPREELQIQPFSVLPSAQPRSSFLSSSSSSPPFANMSTYSTQAASYSLPSPPTSQLERPESPFSVDSQPTLRQGDSRVLSPPMSPIPRPQNRISGGSGSGSRHARISEDVDTRALNAVVDGIGRMQVNMNLDQAGRWRIARRPGAPW
ncbi:hypothetical protein TGAMA5MH_03980 [Trichoderma gamsii]|uniref:Uncharacterized protein n=1 Tax=Trichoderma gamsii TaxID=398673 RepID=A0A2K0TFT0_9HYPO|nr:hypothetical protein TGAMA5MH_03980 [Trichoderma gamsii]